MRQRTTGAFRGLNFEHQNGVFANYFAMVIKVTLQRHLVAMVRSGLQIFNADVGWNIFISIMPRLPAASTIILLVRHAYASIRFIKYSILVCSLMLCRSLAGATSLVDKIKVWSSMWSAIYFWLYCKHSWVFEVKGNFLWLKYWASK